MKLRTALFASCVTAAAGLCSAASAADAALALSTRTPIKHLIVVVGENATFDTPFGTYQPAPGVSVRNLLSQRIVNADGSPGVDYSRAVQFQEQNLPGTYSVDPTRIAPYAQLPQPTLIGSFNPATLQPFGAIADPRFAARNTHGPFQITKFAP